MKVLMNSVKLLTLGLIVVIVHKLVPGIGDEHVIQQIEPSLSEFKSAPANDRITNRDTVIDWSENSRELAISAEQESETSQAIKQTPEQTELVYLDNDGDGFYEAIQDTRFKKPINHDSKQRAVHANTDHDGDGLPDTMTLVSQEQSGSKQGATHYLTDHDGDGLPD